MNEPTSESRCPRCGAVNRATARFCEACGTRLDDPHPLAQPATQVATAPGPPANGAEHAAAPAYRTAEAVDATAPANLPAARSARWGEAAGPDATSPRPHPARAPLPPAPVRVVEPVVPGAPTRPPAEERGWLMTAPPGSIALRSLLSLLVGVVLWLLNRFDPTGSAGIVAQWAVYLAAILLLAALVRLVLRR